MKTGTIVLIPFPFAELTHTKVHPALVVTTTKDKYQATCSLTLLTGRLRQLIHYAFTRTYFN